MVQAAVVNVIEPIFERDFAEQSYGFRPGRGCKDALRRVDGLLKAGYVHVVDADLKGYFNAIPLDGLMARLKEKIADGSALSLIESLLKADLMDGLEGWTPATGVPQGAVLSPLLSNIYLDPLDHLFSRSGLEMVRYADDFVILCRTPEEASRALELVRASVSDHGLTLHPTKSKVVDARTDGFDFLFLFIDRSTRGGAAFDPPDGACDKGGKRSGRPDGRASCSLRRWGSSHRGTPSACSTARPPSTAKGRCWPSWSGCGSSRSGRIGSRGPRTR